MSDKITADSKVTLEIDLKNFLGAAIGWSEEDGYTESLGGAIISQTASILAHSMERDVKSRIQPVLEAKVDELITSLLTEEYQPTDHYGSKKGEPTTLKAEIAQIAETALKSGMLNADDSYSHTRTSGKGGLRKYIEAEVDKVIKTDLKKSLDDAKKAVLDRVKENAAAVIADTITRTGIR